MAYNKELWNSQAEFDDFVQAMKNGLLENKMKLSSDDYDQLISIIDNPPEPTNKMKNLIKKYKENNILKTRD